MDISKLYENGGWGPVILLLYSGVLVLSIYPEGLEIWVFATIPFPVDVIALALLPPLSVMFTNSLTDRVWFFFAGGNLRRSKDMAAKMMGHGNIYYGANEQVQNQLDELDAMAYKYGNFLVSGLIIFFTAPPLGYLLNGLIGVVIGVILSVVAYVLLVRPSIVELNSLAKQIAEVYKPHYED